MEVINLRTEEDKKKIKVGASLKEDVEKNLVKLLQEYVDVFAWSYQDMPRLDMDIVMHTSTQARMSASKVETNKNHTLHVSQDHRRG